jgi:type II secretory pathway pseudopilin PulG
MREKFSRRGFTLFEIMISFLLLILIGGSILLIFTGVAAGTRKADVNMEPLNTLEVLAEIFRSRVSKYPDVSVPRGATCGGYVYQVDDVTINENPVAGSTSSVIMRRLSVHVFFYSPDRTGGEVEREYVNTFYVGQ